MIFPAGATHKFQAGLTARTHWALCAIVLANPSFVASCADSPGRDVSSSASPCRRLVLHRCPLLCRLFLECIISPDDVLAVNVYDATDVTG